LRKDKADPCVVLLAKSQITIKLYDWTSILMIFFGIFVAVVMHKDKEDGMHHDSQFRNRDLTTYDHTLLDGEMFLQVCLIFDNFPTTS
jgi:hypothetical protein